MLTAEQCKKKLFKLGIKYGVSPNLIATRLLSRDDKHDMLNGLFTDEFLDCHVKVWKEFGMCNYADGSGKPYKVRFKD